MPRVRIQEMAQDPEYAITSITEEIKNNTEGKFTGLQNQLDDRVKLLTEQVDSNFSDLDSKISKTDKELTQKYVEVLAKFCALQNKLQNTRIYLTIMNIISLLLIIFLLIRG